MKIFSKIKITPVTVNKFYSINNINITNSNKNNVNASFGDKMVSQTKVKRGLSLGNNYDYSQKSINLYNEFDLYPENNYKINQKSQVLNNQKSKEESYLEKRLPIRKLDFKDETNNKFNYSNLKFSNDKNYKNNDSINFSNLRFQSCKSKIE